MLPPVIPMPMLHSSHSEASWWLPSELPSYELPKGILPRHHCFTATSSIWGPRNLNYFIGIPTGIRVICSPLVFLIAAEAGPPTGSPPMRLLPGGWRANKPRGPGCQRPAAAGCGLAWLGSGLALAGFWFGFRLDFGLILFGFRLRLDFGLILVWLDLYSV